jgi:hypothetical protein
MSHPTERLISCCGRAEVEIDELMVPLMRALWARGVHTCNGCCQGDPCGKARIWFPDIGEADKFACLYFGAYLNECEQLRKAGQDPPLGDRPVDRWEWSVFFRLPLMTRGTISVRFPHEQIDDVTRWLEASTADRLDQLPRHPEQVPVFEYAGRTLADVMAERHPPQSPPSPVYGSCLSCGHDTAVKSDGDWRHIKCATLEHAMP